MSDLIVPAVDVHSTPTVYVVDDDISFGKWVTELLQSISVEAQYFTHPTNFLDAFDPNRFGCVLLDVRLPEMSGMEVLRRLVNRDVQTPVIMITAYGEVSMAVEALKVGAVDFIQKPTSAQSLLDRIQSALAVGWERHNSSSFATEVRDRLSSLSPRETETMDLLLEGHTTKKIASMLNIAVTTVDFHRHNLLSKMKVDNIVTLIHLIDRYKQVFESTIKHSSGPATRPQER